jgi:hypothetical protein
MKVICIYGVKKGDLNHSNPSFPAPKYDEIYEGEIYTVLSSITWEGHLVYSLEERRPDALYSADCFAPISDIDETELIKEREDAYAIQ